MPLEPNLVSHLRRFNDEDIHHFQKLFNDQIEEIAEALERLGKEEFSVDITKTELITILNQILQDIENGRESTIVKIDQDGVFQLMLPRPSLFTKEGMTSKFIAEAMEAREKMLQDSQGSVTGQQLQEGFAVYCASVSTL